jgi:ABC-type phosphate transport system substrate-binding protein
LKEIRKTSKADNRESGWKKASPHTADNRATPGQDKIFFNYSFVANTDQVRPLIIDGQNPDDHQSEYPVRRVLYLTTFGPPQGAVKEFLDWFFFR